MEGRGRSERKEKIRLCLTIRGEKRDETIGEDKEKGKRKKKGEGEKIDPKI